MQSCPVLDYGAAYGSQDEAYRQVRVIGDAPLYDAVRCRARAGDAQARYVMGQFYQYGVNVIADQRLAIDWYESAATPSSGRRYYYAPPVGKEKYGHVRSVPAGTASPGHAGAQMALARAYFDGNGVARDLDKARLWASRALVQGYPGAFQLMQAIEAAQAGK
ncbi:MAG: hypothetical protein ACOY99_12925 [Pseudomonadota bacterium]